MLYLALLTQPPPDDGALRGVLYVPIAAASRFTALGALVAFFTGDLPPAQLRDILTPLLVFERDPAAVGRLDALLAAASCFPKWGQDVEIFRDAATGGLEFCKAGRVVAKLGDSAASLGSIKSL